MVIEILTLHQDLHFTTGLQVYIMSNIAGIAVKHLLKDDLNMSKQRLKITKGTSSMQQINK